MSAEYTTHLITEMLSKEHPDVTYMKKEEISLVLSRSLSQTYLTKPKNPIEYFAKSLLAQANTKRARQAVR
jgi:hypothetical protein